MIFSFSDKISLNRKIGYIGLMLMIVSIVLLSMVDPATVQFLPWIMLLFVSGASLIFLALMRKNIYDTYKRLGILSLAFFAIVIPGIIIILLHLVCILTSFEEFGERYILLNSAWILCANIPLLLILGFVIHGRKKSAETFPG